MRAIISNVARAERTYAAASKHVAGVSAIALAIVVSAQSAARAQDLPADAQSIATVPQTDFNGWFASGSPTENGLVNPANSITFSNNPTLKNVDFYQWSERMFLWVTSPAPGKYGEPVFASPTFFDVSPVDANHHRTFIPHDPNQPPVLKLNLRAAQPGPHGLPVVLSKKGILFEVAPAALGSGLARVVAGPEGRATAFARVAVEGRKANFLNSAGQPIANAKPLFAPQFAESRVVQRFQLDNKPIFVDPSGDVVDVVTGEADGGVLLRQDSTPIYYGIAVNDVYAYFRTGVLNNAITPATAPFPTTQAELDKIVNFAGQPGPNQRTFTDPNALAIEVKTAWVEAAGLSDVDKYITMMGTVPTYDTTNPKQWTANGGQKKIKLALVGIHVVGSANGHPEMIWATFEHFGNTPNAAYAYNSKNGPNPKTVPQNTMGTWSFCADGANIGALFNVARQTITSGQVGASIVADTSQGSPYGPNNTIGPSNSIRFMPFGAASDQKPNPLIADSAESNTQIISINNSVRKQLKGKDIRKNYYFVGSTWTENGAPPTECFPQGNQVGTSQLANSTMETFQQATDSKFTAGISCFACHSNGNQPLTHVSHIYGGLQKLF
jgi:hypothetical protein